jgi:hypothetical protein
MHFASQNGIVPSRNRLQRTSQRRQAFCLRGERRAKTTSPLSSNAFHERLRRAARRRQSSSACDLAGVKAAQGGRGWRGGRSSQPGRAELLLVECPLGPIRSGCRVRAEGGPPAREASRRRLRRAAQFSSFIPQTCPPWPRAKEPHMAAARPRLEAGPPASTGAVTQARAGRQRDRARRRSRRRAPERSFVLACGGGATGAHRSGGSSSRVEAGPSARTGAAARPRASFPPSSPSTSTSTRRMCRSVTSLVSSSSSPTAVQASCSMECRCCAPDFFCVVASRRFASIWNASHSWRSHFFVFSSVLCARCKSCFASPVCNTLLELQATHI